MPYYAVKKGRVPGVYESWADAKKQIDDYSGPIFRKFDNREEASDFVGEKRQLQITNFFERSEKKAQEEGEKTLICFTDGSAIGNGKAHCRAGYGVVWPYHPEFDCCESVEPATNNRAEYSGVVRALEIADSLDPDRIKTLIVYTDSMLLINSLTKWLPGWKRNGYKKADGEPVKNLDLVKRLENGIFDRKTVFRHVKAHTNLKTWEAEFNDKVDRLAKSVTAKN